MGKSEGNSIARILYEVTAKSKGFNILRDQLELVLVQQFIGTGGIGVAAGLCEWVKAQDGLDITGMTKSHLLESHQSAHLLGMSIHITEAKDIPIQDPHTGLVVVEMTSSQAGHVAAET